MPTIPQKLSFSKDLTVIPRPETTQISYIQSSYNDQKEVRQIPVPLYAFSNDHWQTVLNTLGVSTHIFKHWPGLHEGKSVCTVCNAVYAGKDQVCTKVVRKITFSDWGSTFHYSEKYFKGDMAPDPSAYYDKERRHLVKGVKHEVCGGFLKWEHEDLFQTQVKFINLINEISPFIGDNVVFGEFGNLFSEDIKRKIIINMIFGKLMDLQIKQEHHEGAIGQIAQKMHNAGHHLSF